MLNRPSPGEGVGAGPVAGAGAGAPPQIPQGLSPQIPQGLPPGAVSIQVTPEEKEAIERVSYVDTSYDNCITGECFN